MKKQTMRSDSRVPRGALCIGCATILFLLLTVSGFAQNGPPPFPSQFFYFTPDFETLWNSPPIAFSTNLISVEVDAWPYYSDALILDTTNLSPAYLEYYVQDTNGNNNFSYDPATVLFYFAPNWASVSQGGTGPGETAYFFGSGDWSSNSPNGLMAIYADAGGSNIYFGGVSNGVAVTYASAPISWASNSFHQIGVEWTTFGNRLFRVSQIYLDGALATTGSEVSIVPELGTDTNGVCTNGFFIGSDNNGYEQARGAFWGLTVWTEAYWEYSGGWFQASNSLAAWQATLGDGFGGMMGGGFGMPMGSIGGVGNLTPIGASTNNIIGTNVYITNMAAMPDTNGDGGMTFVFTIEGGTNGALYDVFTTTNLIGNNITDANWTWLGQGTNCGSYSVSNQPMNQSFYFLEGTLATKDSDCLFVVYAQPITSTGDLGTCPGPYTGYVNYTPTNGAWGFTPLTNTTVFTVWDTNRTNTKVEYVGAYGDEGCAQTTVTIPNPPFSPAYRFSIYFTNDVPSSNYPITLSGFSP